ncbi:hypothetical protein Hypma_013153, partial [Hypsizygus marmoreus]
LHYDTFHDALARSST